MLFRRSDHKNKPSGISALLRMLLSIVIFAILAVGLYRAYMYFSGFDPLKLNPKSIIENLLARESLYEAINKVFTIAPPGSLEEARKVLNNPQKQNQGVQNSSFMFRFAVVSDSHSDTQNLWKSLNQAKQSGAQFVIGLGDFSNVGTIDELRNSKEQFDRLGLTYYVTAGDHDLWDARDKGLGAEANFKEVLGPAFQSFSYSGIRFIVLYNSDNYYGLDDYQLNWLKSELDRVEEESYKAVFVFAGIPLYHPSSDHVMGKTTPKLKSQSEHIINILSRAGVAEVIAGDTHYFSRYSEPESGLKMTSVGAVTSERNPQSPRFALIDVFQDGSYNVQDVEIR